MTDIFISYSRKDKPWVKTLAATLVAEGYDVWWDPEILPGQDYETVIKEALESTKCVLTVWSKDAIQSTWVKAESNKGLARNVYVPVLYHDVEPPMQFGHIQSADLQKWKGKTDDPRYQQLLRAIAIHAPLEGGTPPPSPPAKQSKPWSWVIGILAVIGVASAGYVALQPTEENEATTLHITDNSQAQEIAKAEAEAKRLAQEKKDEEEKARKLAEEKKQQAAAEAEAKRLAQEKKDEEKKQQAEAQAEKERLAEEKKEKAVKLAQEKLETARLKAEKLAKEKKEKEAKAKKLAKERKQAEAKKKAALAKQKAAQLAKQNKQTRIDHYIDNGDGTVTDTKTGLMWKKCREGLSGSNCGQGEVKAYTWSEAIKKGKGAIFAGHSDWRLPTRKELRSLVYCSNGIPQKEAWDEGCSGKDDRGGDYKSPTIDQKAFPNTGNTFYWSSSPYARVSNRAWGVNFSYGYVSVLNEYNSYRVRLVRSGQ